LQGTKLPRHREFNKDIALWKTWPKHGPAKIPSHLTQLQEIEQKLLAASEKYQDASIKGNTEGMARALNEIQSISDSYTKYRTAADVGDVEGMTQAFNKTETLPDQYTKAPEGVRDAGRLYLFILAEELYPKRFQELKRRAMPFYAPATPSVVRADQPIVTPTVRDDREFRLMRGFIGPNGLLERIADLQRHTPGCGGSLHSAALTCEYVQSASQMVVCCGCGRTVKQSGGVPGFMELLSCPHCGARLAVVCRGHVKFSSPAVVELERRIADWVKRLGIVRSENGIDDFWLRQLAMKRLQAWYDGQPQMRMPGFFTPSRRSGESLQDFGKRQRSWQSVANPRAKRVFKHHFAWFLKYRMEDRFRTEGISLEKVGRLSANPGAIAPTPAAVFYGVQGVADLIEVAL
jgi:hypothetical protein